MKQLILGMVVLNVVAGSFCLAAGVYILAPLLFTATYLWSRLL